MLQSFADIFKIPELKRRVFFTMMIIAVYRIGAAIPIPDINTIALRSFFQAQGNTLLGFLDMFSGGALGRFSIFSMGIMPYINASIIMSLLQGAHVFPYLDRLAKEGDMGRKKINQITRYLTLCLGSLQSFGLTMAMKAVTAPGGAKIINNDTWAFVFLTVLTLTTGTVFIMWLGEQITEKGIGNGISLIIFAGIVDRLPSAIRNLIRLVRIEELQFLTAVFLVLFVVVVVALVVWVETGQRKIPVQYAKRVVGRHMVGGSSTYLPIKVDQSGVIAVIFAMSLLTMPMTLAQFFPESAFGSFLGKWFPFGAWQYQMVYAGLIIFFCYFYNSISFNPNELAENMKKWGGFISGIRPGEATAQYISRILERITLWGALFVAAIAVMPNFLQKWLNAPFFFGGTALLIVVGVALDTIGQLESHLIMRHYDGFMKSGRIKGRWFNVK